MLIVIFLEISIAVANVLGGTLVVSKYLTERKPQDLYVFLILVGATIADGGMLFSQIAYNLQYPFAYLGFKVFIYCVILATVIIWFHLSSIYGVRSRLATLLFTAMAAASIYYFWQAKIDIAFQEGVIVPVGDILNFVTGFLILAVIVTVQSILSITGLKRIKPSAEPRYLIHKVSASLFFVFLICFAVYMVTRLIWIYVFMWALVFLAMLLLFMFSMLPEDSPVLRNPFAYFRTRILFKLIITLIVMIIISLEGIAFISISISKKALSESVIEGYKKVADDTIRLINTRKIDASSEPSTLKEIAKILEFTKIGDRGSVFLVSPEKNIYINRGNGWVSLGSSQSFNKSHVLAKNAPGGEMDIFGERIIAAYIPIKKLKWSIVVGQPINYAYGRIKQMESTFIMFTFSWILLTIFVGIILARNIEEPVKAIKKGIGKISQGDLDYKINIDNIDELGELADSFNKMTKQLKETQESLLRSERLASLGYMAAGMAHEIKNALVPLKTLTDLLMVSGKDQAFVAKFNELVPREIDRINMLSTDLLHYSRPSEPKMERLDMNGVMDETAKFLELQARKKNITFKLKPSVISKVKADRNKMLQAITNIVQNAIEAMSGGEITLSSYEKDDRVVIEISDNGPGISEKNLNMVFVPFFTTKKEGTGMGLAITQRIMADHGGTITLKNTPGSGAIFFLSLPKIS